METHDKTKVHKMMCDNRIRYPSGTDLGKLVKAIIDRTAFNEALEAIHYINKKEYAEAHKQNNKENEPYYCTR